MYNISATAGLELIVVVVVIYNRYRLTAVRVICVQVIIYTHSTHYTAV